MSVLRTVLVAAAVGASLVACSSAGPEPSGSSNEDLIRGPNPGNYICAYGPQTQMTWQPGQGTINAALKYYQRSTYVGWAWTTFAGVDPQGNVDLIVWVEFGNVEAFEWQNDFCYVPPPMPSGGPKPPGTAPGGTTGCPPPMGIPGNAPCVTLSELGSFWDDTACTEPSIVGIGVRRDAFLRRNARVRAARP